MRWLTSMMAAAGDVPPSAWEQFGPFAICFVVLSAVIAWLLRDRAKLIDELSAERKANLDLYERIIDSGERTVPMLDRAAAALEHVAGGRL